MDLPNKNKGDERRRQQDLDDLQNEIAGCETGRMSRFLPRDERSPEGQKRKAEQERFNRLMQLLSDPAYLVVYERTMQALTDAEQAVDRTLLRLELEIAQADAALGNIRAHAARLPDGTRIYRDAQGVVRREDGSIVDDDLAATIMWRGDEPGFDSFSIARDRLADLHAGRDEILTYQNDVLGPARDRLSDEDDPPSVDELHDMLDEIEQRLPAHIAIERAPAEAVLPDVARGAAIKAPEL